MCDKLLLIPPLKTFSNQEIHKHQQFNKYPTMIEIPMPTLPGPDSSPPSSPDGLRISESLAPTRVLKAAMTTDISFDGLLKEPLLLKEDLKDGCGGQLWPAGMALAKYLLSRHATDLSDKTMWVLS
jgi:hypothetical protein